MKPARCAASDTIHVPTFTKPRLRAGQYVPACLLVLAGILLAGTIHAAVTAGGGGGGGSAAVAVQSAPGGGGFAGGSAESNASAVSAAAPEQESDAETPASHGRGWLGVGVEEASEALASQLNLAPGVGLVVTYVTPDSPAAKAGLQMNDVLVEFEGQPLVHPQQLRKLVQVRKEGDKVELGFYRGGKKQTVSVTLGKAPAGYGLLEDGEALRGDLAGLRRQFRAWPMGDAWRDAMNAYRDQMGHMKIDRSKVEEEVRRSMEQARAAAEIALRYSTNAASSAVASVLKELQHSGLMPDNNASVTVRSSGDKVRSVVKADESGTYVIVSNPKPRLTAHDKDGKLLFDGEIDTPEQRAKVPPEVWQKVEPMLDKLAPKAEEDSVGQRPAPPLPPRPPVRPLAPVPAAPDTTL
ncbi:MAG TPA: PDZ domain-containing protein [Candidatus Acidoferrum sp.]|nr:PDZ domain-containing protein [Candidatus Acidoferrum sp.]